jgi:hypothetical protein
MAQRSIDITQIGAGIGNNGNTLVVQGNTFVFAAAGASSSFTGTTTNVPEGANLYFTSARALTAVNGFINTSNVVESATNLYFTNARALAAVQNSITTTSVAEGNNLYFSNVRAVAAVKDNVSTSNVTEGANLYFTNTRAVAAVKDNVSTSNVTEGANLYFTNTRAIYALTAGQNISISGTGTITATSQAFTGNTNLVPEGSANLYFTNTRAVAAVKDNINTSNVIEGSNLYFTNTRAIFAFTAGQNITISDTGTITGAAQAFTGNTNSVPEGTANLYFTNTRAVGSLTAGQNIAIAANGLVGTTRDQTIGGNLSVLGNQNVSGNLTVQGNLFVTGNIASINVLNLKVSDNMIYLNSNSDITNPDLGFAGNYNDGTYAHTGVFRDATDSRWKFFEGYTPEPDADIYINTAHASFRLANIEARTFFGDGTGISGITASQIVESGTTTTGNVFFTNARAISAFTAGQNITIATDGTITGASQAFTGNTNFVPEGSANLYFTNVRAVAAVQNNISTSSVTEGSNLYFTNTRAIYALTAGQNITISDTGTITGATQAFTGNTNFVPEGSANLYFTSARAIAAVKDNISTSNVTEGANLYFTNTRAISALTAGTGITISAGGTIAASGGGGTSGNVSEKYNRTINNAVPYPITSALANALVIPSGAANTYIVHSIYVTNIDSNLSNNVAVTGNFVFSSPSANVSFANKIPVPARSSLELLRKPQILQANDLIKLQSFDSGVAIGNVLHSIVVYENKSSVEGYVGVGVNADTATGDVYVSTGVSTIIDSIKLVNSGDIGNIAITVTWTDASNVIQSYLTSTFIVPQNSSVELCEAPKRIPSGHKIRALATTASQVSVLLSGRTL